MIRLCHVLIFLLLTHVVCEAQLIRNGRVTDNNYQAVAYVTVDVRFDSDNANNKVDNNPHTDARGNFHIRFHKGIDITQNIDIIFHKEGYADQTISTTVNDNDPLNVTLLPKGNPKYTKSKPAQPKIGHKSKPPVNLPTIEKSRDDFSAVNKISKGLISNDSTMRYDALLALTTISQSAEGSLNTVLHILMEDKSQKNRTAACNFLIALNYNAKDVEQALIYSLTNLKNTELRINSAYALKMIAPLSQEGVSSLIYALKDPELKVNINALYTLNKSIGILPGEIDERMSNIIAAGLNMAKDSIYKKRCYKLIAMYAQYRPSLWNLWVNRLRKNDELAFDELGNSSFRDSLVIRAIKLESNNYLTSKRMSIYNAYLEKYTPGNPIELLAAAYNDNFYYYNNYINRLRHVSYPIVIRENDSSVYSYNDPVNELTYDGINIANTAVNSMMVNKLKGIVKRTPRDLANYIRKSPNDIWLLDVAYQCDSNTINNNTINLISKSILESFNNMDTIKWELTLNFLLRIKEKANFIVIKLPDILDSLCNSSDLSETARDELQSYAAPLILNCKEYLGSVASSFEQKYLRYGRNHFFPLNIYWDVVHYSLTTEPASLRLFCRLLKDHHEIETHFVFIAHYLPLTNVTSATLSSFKSFMVQHRNTFSKRYPTETEAVLKYLGIDTKQ